MELSEHVALLAKIRDMIPEKDIALVIYQEMNKDRRGNEANMNRNGFKTADKLPNPENESPTEKQIIFLKKHSDSIPKTRAEATKLIGDIMKEWKQE